jgi:dihydropteroate synthase
MNKNVSYQPKIMGVVNVTPDSFSDGGDFIDTDKAISHGLQLVKDGAYILDIGGESTRPGALPISIEVEIGRVVPMIKILRQETNAQISVDTRNSAVMLASMEVGATMINDVTALTHDPSSMTLVAEKNASVCLMHMKGEPSTMQNEPAYQDVVAEVYDYLAERVESCLRAGVKKDLIYVDVGIGFGKTLEHNLLLLKNLHRFRDLGVQLVLGTSRKSFIEKIVQTETKPRDRLAGSLASLVPAIEAKVDILRVHDVKETKQFLEVYKNLID